jgi:hypothetical protein
MPSHSHTSYLSMVIKVVKSIEEMSFLGDNFLQSVRSQPTFRRNISLLLEVRKISLLPLLPTSLVSCLVHPSSPEVEALFCSETSLDIPEDRRCCGSTELCRSLSLLLGATLCLAFPTFHALGVFRSNNGCHIALFVKQITAVLRLSK